MPASVRYGRLKVAGCCLLYFSTCYFSKMILMMNFSVIPCSRSHMMIRQWLIRTSLQIYFSRSSAHNVHSLMIVSCLVAVSSIPMHQYV